jgi:hypothetical protein
MSSRIGPAVSFHDDDSFPTSAPLTRTAEKADQAPANEGLVPIRPLKIDRKQTDPIFRDPKQMQEESDFLQAFISTHDTDNFTIHSATPKRVHS